MTKNLFKFNTNEEKNGVEKTKSKMSLKFKTKKKSKFKKSKTNVNNIEIKWYYHGCGEDRADMRKCFQCGKWYYEECISLSAEDANNLIVSALMVVIRIII